MMSNFPELMCVGGEVYRERGYTNVCPGRMHLGEEYHDTLHYGRHVSGRALGGGQHVCQYCSTVFFEEENRLEQCAEWTQLMDYLAKSDSI